MFDCLHDMGDPVGAAAHVLQALSEDGTWMVVEPNAGDRLEDNINPVGRVFYGASTLVCTPASRDQEVGLALGAQAGEARLRDVDHRGRVHPLPAGRRDPVQHRARGAALAPARGTFQPRPDDQGDRTTMICTLTARRLRPGAYEAFRAAWDPSTADLEALRGWTHIYHGRDVAEPDVVISFGLFDGSLEQLREAQSRLGRASQVDRIEANVEHVLLDGSYEIVEELTP